jgi:hypothetical protein
MTNYLLAAALAIALPGELARGIEPETSGGGTSAKQPLEPPRGELPWEGMRKPARLPGRKFQNAKELLELLGVDASQWRNLFHDQPLGSADEEWIDRILFHLPRIGADNTFRWRKTDWRFDEIAAAPAKFQGEMLALRGRATRCERVPLLAELVDRYEYDHYYRVHISLDDGHEAIVCTRTVPQAWTKQEQLDERVEANGIFLKTSPVENASPQLICASLRVAWLPDRVEPDQRVTAESILLAEHGFDFGLWDQLKGPAKRGFDENDREPFFQLLGAMVTLPPTTPSLLSAADLDVTLAIQSPDKQRGQFVTVDGNVVRIDRVEVKEGDVQARFGLDHYYELFVFVPLKKGIKLQRSSKDKGSRIFSNHYPVTVCVPELPPQLQAVPNVHEHVRMHGVYYKMWHYKIQGDETSPAGGELQASPLIVASKVELVSDSSAPDPSTSVAGGVVFVALIGVLGVVLWRMSRSDARFKREVLEKKILREDQVDLSHLKD